MRFAAWMKFNTHIGFNISRHHHHPHSANAKQRRRNAQLFSSLLFDLLLFLLLLSDLKLGRIMNLLFRFRWRFIDQMNNTDSSLYSHFSFVFDFPWHFVLYSEFQFRFGFSFMIPLFVIFVVEQRINLWKEMNSFQMILLVFFLCWKHPYLVIIYLCQCWGLKL